MIRNKTKRAAPPAARRRTLATVQAELAELQAEERELAAAADERQQAKLVSDLARIDFGLAAGQVGRPGKFIASHPTLGQVTADDPDKLLRRARGKHADARLRGEV